MLFSSFSFIFAFLPLVILLYYLFKNRVYRNFVLLAASLLFYAWGEPRYLLILLISILITWAAALALARFRCKRLCLFIALVVDLGILVYFKYTDFLLENLSALFSQSWDPLRIVMPIGISFYTFQAISYLVDVYRGEVPVQRSLYKLMLYITLFPQLVAGPIVKYHDVCLQINERGETWKQFTHGLRRFIFGLAKKMLIANAMGAVADRIFNLPMADIDTLTAWQGALAYTLQIYFDFSGYSDMAIGLCLMFGFRLPENFNYPYISRSITEFWRRWHISLSTWFKEYLYIPLGGNRVSKWRNYFNLFCVFLATGIWHGAAWNFIIWGLWHGLFIIVEKLTGWHKREGGIIFRTAQHVLLLLIVIIGWVFFRADTLTYATEYLQNMAGFGGAAFADVNHLYFMDQYTGIIMAAGLLLALPVARGWAYVQNHYAAPVINILCLVLFYLSWMELAASTYNPFIYFRF